MLKPLRPDHGYEGTPVSILSFAGRGQVIGATCSWEWHVSTERLVVVGGDAAAMTAASQARRARPDLEIIALEKGSYVSYAACGIPYYVGGVIDSYESLLVRTPEQFRQKQNIDVRIGQEVVGVGPTAARVVIRDLESGREYEEPYDQLLLAMGAASIRLELPGVDVQGVYYMASIDDARAVRAVLERARPRRAVIVGGGFVGIEMAEALMRWGVDVSIVGRAPQLMRNIDPDMSALVSEGLARMGVHLYLGEAASAFEQTAGRVAAVVTGERSLPADMVILATGVRPNAGLAAEAGLDIGRTGSIKVDDHLRTSRAGVWAAGDCAETVHLVTGDPFWISSATVASKQGRVVGTNISGGDAFFAGVLGTAIVKAGPVEISRTGLQETELADRDIRFATEKVDFTTTAGYYPASEPMTVKLIAETGSGRLLGGQIVGGAGAAMRINVVVAALQSGMTVEELETLDLAYSPPFSAVWDPLLLAARGLRAKV